MLSSDYLKSFISIGPILKLHVGAFFFRLWESVRVAIRYWRKISFLASDLYLALHYLGRSAYRLARGEQPYGETPLTTLDRIARECRLLSKDVVVDLGCGRGRGVLWLSHFVRCQAIGVDRIQPFIARASRVKNHLRLERSAFWQCGIESVDLSRATAVYFYGTGFSDELLRSLVERLKTLKAGAKVITVSYPLTDIEGSGPFRVIKSFPARYPWGKTQVYLHTYEPEL